MVAESASVWGEGVRALCHQPGALDDRSPSLRFAGRLGRGRLGQAGRTRRPPPVPSSRSSRFSPAPRPWARRHPGPPGTATGTGTVTYARQWLRGRRGDQGRQARPMSRRWRMTAPPDRAGCRDRRQRHHLCDLERAGDQLCRIPWPASLKSAASFFSKAAIAFYWSEMNG